MGEGKRAVKPRPLPRRLDGMNSKVASGRRPAWAAGIIAIVLAFPVAAEEPGDNRVFVFTGRYHTGHMEHILNPAAPLGLDYEDNYVAGVGVQQFVPDEDGKGVRIGWEGGAAIRTGESTSGEAWTGIVGRVDGAHIGPVNVSPALTVGLSAVTDTIGIESERVAEGADPHLLFYIAPEINVSVGENADTEVFMRVQHRSGAWGLLNDMGDGHNATAVGMRWRF